MKDAVPKPFDPPTPPFRDRSLAGLVEEYKRQRQLGKPPLLHPHGTSRIQFGAATHCPFDNALLTRRFGFSGIPLTEEETARCVAARQHGIQSIVERVTVPVLPAPVSSGLPLAYPVLAHVHVEVLIDGHRVHLEAIDQKLGGPGGVNREIRVYADGVLGGRGHLLGRLGGNVRTLPAVADIGENLVISVEPVDWSPLDELIVELSTVIEVRS
jgi:hypothetical protein